MPPEGWTLDGMEKAKMPVTSKTPLLLPGERSPKMEKAVIRRLLIKLHLVKDLGSESDK